MSQNIEHKGEIIEIDAEVISVEIINKSACSSCGSKTMCSMGESQSKIIQVENSGYSFFEKGEIVNVILKRSMGFKALWLSYLIPLVILVVLLVSLSTFGVNELLTGVTIVIALAVYYFVIFLLRDRIKKDFVFTIEKLK